MSVLVVYGSRYGATRAIAERIGAVLRAGGHQVDVAQATPVLDPRPYDAFVIGSAAYRGSWLTGPSEFALRHLDLLADRPVWLFSSGPLGTTPVDGHGQDLREQTRPRQFGELAGAISPRGTAVFFGALDPGRLRWPDRLVRHLPGGRRLLPAGDFRDWATVESWARDIAAQL